MISATHQTHVEFSIEKWASAWPEISNLWEMHWKEVCQDRDRIQLDVDLEAYDALEKAGILHLVVARSNRELIGYHISLVNTHAHFRNSLYAFTDAFYIAPNHRKGFTGVHLLQEVEKSLKARGVVKMTGAAPMHSNIGKLFEYLGWTEVERTYTKYIGGL